MIYSKFFKRPLDILISLLILIVSLPFLLIISLLIALFSGIPIFFIQVRPGYRGRIFKMIKFKTMSDSVDVYGNLLPDNIRITPIGRFLRKSSIDELPELINVIKGDMSLVGPRPLLVKYLPYYSSRESRRHEVKPGITGLAQVSGRNAVNWDKRLELDVQYVETISFKLDIKILVKTIGIVIISHGVSVDTATNEPSLTEYRKNKKFE